MTSLIVLLCLVFAAGLVIGLTAGDWWGERRATLEAAEDRAAVRAAGQFRAMREPMWEYRAVNRALAGRVVQLPQRPPEVAHEWGRPPGQAAEEFDVDAIIAGFHTEVSEFLATVVDRYRPLYPELEAGQ